MTRLLRETWAHTFIWKQYDDFNTNLVLCIDSEVTEASIDTRWADEVASTCCLEAVTEAQSCCCMTHVPLNKDQSSQPALTVLSTAGVAEDGLSDSVYEIKIGEIVDLLWPLIVTK